MKELFLYLSGGFAAIPGLLVLASAIGVPDPSEKYLFGSLIEIFGCLTLGILLLNKEKLQQASLQKITYWIVISCILFLISLIGYVILYNICVKDHSDITPVYFPLFYSPELKEAIAKEGGKMQFIEKWLGDGASLKIQKLAFRELIITNIIFIFIYQLIFTALTLAFGLLAIRIKPQNVPASSVVA